MNAKFNFGISLIVTVFSAIWCKTLENTLFSSPTAHWSFGSYIKRNNVSLEFQLVFTSPSTPGTYPVIFFLSGFDGLAPSFMYSDFTTRLVSESDFIVIMFDKFRFVDLPKKEENIFQITLEWTIENLKGLFDSDKTPSFIKNQVFPDEGPNGFTLMSHSSAGHPITYYLYKQCGPIKKLILMDPVDGVDPFGIIKQFITNPPNQLPFKIPTLIISTGLDPVPVSPKSVACAPTNMSNNRFYESLPGPTFYLNFTSYGHADILDDLARKYIAGLLCTVCDHVNKNCDYDTYRINLVHAIRYFMVAVDQKDSKFLNAIENPTTSGLFNSTINISSKYKLNGFDILNTGPFCNHD